MKTLRILALGMASLLMVLSVAQGENGSTPSGVVSLRVTYQSYDPVLPWNKNVEQSIVGNAVVMKDHLLLTTADLVKNANLLEVRKFGQYPDFPARVLLVDYELNLALLQVDDPVFWEGLNPLPLADKPFITGRLGINRWRPNGRFEQGTGEVVDVGVATSPFGSIEFPVIRASTNMTGLGWGEVLTSEGRIIGLVTGAKGQELQATNVDLLALFVRAAHNHPYRGFAHRGFSWQQLNQPDLRAYFHLKRNGTGVLILHVYPGGTGSKKLKPGDILHRIGPYDINPEGYINHPSYGLIRFAMAINESLAPTLPVEIQRDGKRLKLELERRRFTADAYRVPPPQFGHAADYEVFGGLVLQELSLGYLRAWGTDWKNKAPIRLVMEYVMHNLREVNDPPHKVVFISKVLPDPSNLGYDNVTNAIVVGADGKRLNSLDDFRKAVKSPPNGYHVIEILPGQGRAKLVYSVAGLPAANARIRERYGIPTP